MTFTTFAARVPVGDGRSSSSRNGEILWLVVHTSEQLGETVDTAESLARFIGTPASGGNVASYHYIADTDSVIPVVPDSGRAHHAAGGNTNGLSICIPGRAAQSTDEWFDEITGAYLEQCARWLADKSLEYGIPLVKITAPHLVEGRRGVCGHVDVTNAFRLSTHTDPGPNFPWLWVITRAVKLIAPPPPPPPEPEPPVTDLLLLGGTTMKPRLAKNREGVFFLCTGLAVQPKTAQQVDRLLQKALPGEIRDLMKPRTAVLKSHEDVTEAPPDALQAFGRLVAGSD